MHIANSKAFLSSGRFKSVGFRRWLNPTYKSCCGARRTRPYHSIQGGEAKLERFVGKFERLDCRVACPRRFDWFLRFHLYDNDGNYIKNAIGLWNEDLQDGNPLLVPVVLKGELVYSFPDLAAMQTKAKTEVAMLSEPYKGLTETEEYPVVLSPGLEDLLEQLIQSR